jgi:hypothetical protein
MTELKRIVVRQPSTKEGSNECRLVKKDDIVGQYSFRVVVFTEKNEKYFDYFPPPCSVLLLVSYFVFSSVRTISSSYIIK